ncbi:hypothetical protein [Micromonospora costi]|uniref:Thioredoxin domain-containing protein n=1 Tax=Micromonospora costi TaxID=1530042 RepID=A0A3B0A0M4_9ACTN|nr:hypothetical protein [Micromonospora costi]RKN54102.1 hypothetical protein D7193_18925 [Micromonospora costi]
MNYLTILVMLLVAGAIVLLFAMAGELYARTGGLEGSPESTPGGTGVRPLEGARFGARPRTWPEPFTRFGSGGPHLLLVLSTTCASCEDVAVQLAAQPDTDDLGVVVTTADAADAAQFIHRHGIARFPYLVDEGATWVSTEFGVKISPSAAVIKDGRLVSALLFSDVAATRAAVHAAKEAV